MKSAILGLAILLASLDIARAQEVRGPVKVTIKDGPAIGGAAALAIAGTPGIAGQSEERNMFGLTLEGKLLTACAYGSIWHSLKVDGNNSCPWNAPITRSSPLPTTASGKKRFGTESTWAHAKVHVTQILEFVAGKPSTRSAGPGRQRTLDTCRVTYLLENKDGLAHQVAFRTCAYLRINNNDRALFASPTTAPSKILNGVKLEGKSLPAYLWVLERPDLVHPGMVATMTFKHAKAENPHEVVLTNRHAFACWSAWPVPAQPAGDSACALFWEEKELKPGQKRELVWGYGGGISTSPESEGRVSLGLSGSFEAGKLFTIAAQVEDPAFEQSLALDLPPGLERVEGREIQPVPQPTGSGTSIVLWKARVVRPGDYEIRVRSSMGSVQSKHVLIEPVK